MPRFSLSAALCLATASPALAGPVEVPPALPPVIVDPCPLAFDCFYVGLEYGLGTLEGTEGVTGGNARALDLDGDVYGAFAGYNFQNGSMVYGGELRYLHTALEDPNFSVDAVLDARARIGFAVSDQFMLYGAAGYSTASATVAAVDFNMTGFNYGVGAEFNVSDSFFIGADVTGRDLEGTIGAVTHEGTVNTATLRVGFRF